MSRPIPQTAPGAEYLACRAEIDAAVQRVCAGGRYILGDEVGAFEREFADYLGAAHAIGVASGTDALWLALLAAGVGAGDEVITVAHTAVATVAAIERTGARPVLVDVAEDSFTLDPGALAGATTPRTKAIVPVHLYGQPASMLEIMRFAREHGLRVIEDCAQAHGAAYEIEPGVRRKAGTLGDLAAFSFYPTKNLGALGDGGCVVTGDARAAERVRQFREYGWRERYVSDTGGWNSRLDEVQAAILRVKLRRLDEWNARRAQLATLYDTGLRGSPVRLPARLPNRTHVFHQYVVRVRERERVRVELAAAGVGTGIHYPVPIHRQPAYARLAEGAALPVTESLCREILSLPMHPHLTDGEAARVIDELNRAVR